jgi:Glycosyltransferase family 87
MSASQFDVARRHDQRAAWAGGLALLVCSSLPALVTVARLASSLRHGVFAFDFHNYYWPSGHDVLHGRSPFPPASPEVVFAPFTHIYPAGPYPAPAVVMFVPFGLLPLWLAEGLFTALLIGSLCLALHLVGVRDWRCYGAAFLWAPVGFAIQTANLTLLLLLGLAVLWRVRDRVAPSAIALGVLVSLKLLLWPMVVWLLATRRYAAAAWSFAVAVAVTLGAWGMLGFAGFHNYLRVGRIFADTYERSTYTPFAVLLSLGVPSAAARVGGIALAVAALAGASFAARRKGGDAISFAVAVGAVLLWAPITWLHYFALLLVPLGVLRPKLSVAWLLPAILWFCPVGAPPSTWQFALPLMVSAAVLLLAARDRSRSSLYGVMPSGLRTRRGP